MADGFFANDPAAYLRELQMRLNGSPNNVGAAPGPGFLDQMQRALPVQPATPPTFQTPATPPALGTMFAGNERPDMGAAAGGQLGMPPQAPAAQPQMPGGGFLDGLHNAVLQNRGALAGIGAAIQSGRPVGYAALQGAEIDQKRKDDEENKAREKTFADATSAFIKDPAFQAMVKADPRKASEVLKLFQEQQKEANDQSYRNRSLAIQERQAGRPQTAEIGNNLYERGPDGQWKRVVEGAPARPAPPTGYQWTAEGTLEPIAGGPATRKELTEAEGKARRFSESLSEAEQTIKTYEKAWGENGGTAGKLLGGYVKSVQETLPGGKSFMTEDQRLLDQAKTTFVDAVLRDESGAVIGKDEFVRNADKYFPQPGDSTALIEQKRKARETIIEAIAGKGGHGYRPKADYRTPAPRWDARDGAAPGGGAMPGVPTVGLDGKLR